VRELAERALKKAESTAADISALRTRPAFTSPASAAFVPSGWNSAIVSGFPALFGDFRKKQFTLLWRGSRDGFLARSFHRRCDGHANTLTVILDTKANIFGGFTPVEWESRTDDDDFEYFWRHCFKTDPSLKSFLFTLRNPRNFPARRFPLKAEKKDQAIGCWSYCGPDFGDIGVSENCNRNGTSYTCSFGDSYTNDTGLKGELFFTGSAHFQVKEIEVFEITD
jgi:hypothetical protein